MVCDRAHPPPTLPVLSTPLKRKGFSLGLRKVRGGWGKGPQTVGGSYDDSGGLGPFVRTLQTLRRRPQGTGRRKSETKVKR